MSYEFQFKIILKARILHAFQWGDTHLFLHGSFNCLGLPEIKYDSFVRYMKGYHIYVTSKTRLKREGDRVNIEHYDILIDWNHDPEANKCLAKMMKMV